MRAERVELSRACAHRILNPARLPFPPRPHGGPSRARTGTRLAANEVHCHWCSGPRVPVGRIERPQAQCRAVYSRAPLTNRGHRGGIGRCNRVNRRGPDPQSGVLFSCQCAWMFLPFMANRARLRPAGVVGVEPTSAGLEPAVRTAGLHPFECVLYELHSAQEHKRAAPFRKRLLNELDVYVLFMPLRAPPGGRWWPNRKIARSIAGP